MPLSVLPLTEHTDAPAVTAHETVPPPLPPLDANALLPPRRMVAGLALAVSAACGALATPTATLALAALKLASAALVAVSVQLPTPVAVRVLPLTAHTPAPAVTAQVTAPVPLPPLVESAAVPPNTRFGGEALATRAACSLRASANVPPVALPVPARPPWPRKTLLAKLSATLPATVPAE